MNGSKNPLDRTLRRGETYQPPSHDQSRVDQVNRIMERHGNRQKALEDYVDQEFSNVKGG